jgi:hypothetical protein
MLPAVTVRVASDSGQFGQLLQDRAVLIAWDFEAMAAEDNPPDPSR